MHHWQIKLVSFLAGFIHDTHTLKASLPDSVKITGNLTDEFCWFPGYMYRYVHCSYCGKHLGWKYFSKNLMPRSFLGLSGNSIYFDNASNLEMDNITTQEADSSADEWWIDLSLQLGAENWRKYHLCLSSISIEMIKFSVSSYQ